jgi:leucyl aminopeptidase
VVGLGAADKVSADGARHAAGAAARSALGARARTLAVAAETFPFEAAEASRYIVEGVTAASYQFDRYRTQGVKDRPKPLRSLAVVGGERAAIKRATTVTDAVSRARDLQNTPSRDMTPADLGERAKSIAREHRLVTATVRDQRWIEANGMGAFAAVAQANNSPARLITMRYRPARPRRRDVVLGLVGKGVTFDSGGLSIKPARSMIGMKYDMSGAAAVIEATAAIAELGLPVQVVTVAGATENLVDSRSVMVGDVVTAKNGKTIEISNTDAEGRLVLADCLHHARSLGATHLVDLATLTGGVVVALGDLHAGIMGRDQDWVDQLIAAGERSGDHLWQLPLHDTYLRMFRSDIADFANSSTMGMAQSPYAGRFLQEFAGEGPWAHLDIAGTADLARPRGDEFGKGGTGYGVRLLVELAESLC